MTIIDSLSSLDAAFLHVDRLGSPINVGGVLVFEAGPLLDADGAFRLDEVRALVDERLREVPRLRCRVVPAPFDVARPVWVEDDTFDIARHIDVVELPPGSGDEALRHLAEELYMVPLDPDHPLWHLRFVTGLAGGRIAAIERVHHAVVDGISGVDLAAIMLDVTRQPRPPVELPEQLDGRRRTPAFSDEVRAAVETPAALLRTFGDLLQHPTAVARRAADVARGLGEAFGAGRAPRSSLNAPVGHDRLIEWVSVPLEEVRAAGKAHGGTVNDAILAAVAGGLRELLLHRGEAITADANMRILVPINVRAPDEHGKLGNRVASYLLDMPIGIGDPVERLREIARRMAHLKAGREKQASTAFVHAGDLVPSAVLRVIEPLVAHQPLFNLIVTNVPGSPVPLYLLGSRMLTAHPFIPVTGNLTLGVVILSYDGTIELGITADRDACPDVERFAKGLDAELWAAKG